MRLKFLMKSILSLGGMLLLTILACGPTSTTATGGTGPTTTVTTVSPGTGTSTTTQTTQTVTTQTTTITTQTTRTSTTTDTSQTYTTLTTRTTTLTTTVTTQTTVTQTTTLTTTTRTSTTRTTTATTVTTITTLTTRTTTTTICPWCPKSFDDMEAYNTITSWQFPSPGAWTTYAASGTISAPAAAMTAGVGQGANGSANALCMSYNTTVEAQLQGEFKQQLAPYTLPFAAGELENISSYKQLSLWLKGDGVNSYELRIPGTTINTEYSWTRYTVGVVPNTWTKYVVDFTSFAQPAWATQTEAWALYSTHVQSIQLVDINGGNTTVCIDEVELVPNLTAPTTGTYTTTTLNCNLSNYLAGSPWLTPVDSNLNTLWNNYKTNFVVNCGAPYNDSFVNWVPDNPGDGVSEGIGYGMLLAAYMQDQTTFDRLWKYHQRAANLDAGAYANGGVASGLMHWHTGGCSGGATGGDYSAATDAEHDVAIALLYANILKGSTIWADTGTNYLSDAQSVILKTRQYLIQTDGYVKNGDEWGGPSHPSLKCMNPSYFSPAFYKVFKYYENLWYGPTYNALWDSAVAKSYDVITNNHVAQGYALVPNWSLANGQNNNCSGATATPSNQYGYDAVREPIRISTDLAWYNDSNAATEVGRNKTVWDSVIGGGDNFTNILGPYNLNGTSAGSDANATFRASAAVNYMFYSGADPTAYANAGAIIFSSTSSDISSNLYFNSSVGMYAMLLGSGRFKKPICN